MLLVALGSRYRKDRPTDSRVLLACDGAEVVEFVRVSEPRSSP